MHSVVLFVLVLSAGLMVACGDVAGTPAGGTVLPTTATQPSGTPAAGQATPAPGSGSPGPTPTRAASSPTPSAPASSQTGSLSINDLRQAWTARGLAVSTGPDVSVTGFGLTPTSLRVARGTDASDVLVFAYASEAALAQDWTTAAGGPTPKVGKNPGTSLSAWWNRNVVVVLRSRGIASHDDARDAFLTLGVAASPTALSTPSTAPLTQTPAIPTPTPRR